MASKIERQHHQEADLDTLLKDNSPLLYDGLKHRGISFSALPSFKLEDPNKSSELTVENMSQSIMRLDKPFGLAFHVQNQKWYVPPRMDRRGMKKDPKGYFVNVGKACSAVFVIYARNSFWRYGINEDQKNIGSFEEDCNMSVFYPKHIDWKQIDSLLKDTHPLYKIV